MICMLELPWEDASYSLTQVLSMLPYEIGENPHAKCSQVWADFLEDCWGQRTCTEPSALL